MSASPIHDEVGGLCPDCAAELHSPAPDACGCDALHADRYGVSGTAPLGLNWGGSWHWSSAAQPCQYCGDPAHLRDGARRPAHKVCGERVLDAFLVDRAKAVAR